MGDLNTLIATGGGYQAPNFLGAQKARQDMETQGLQNELAKQQIASEPEKQKLEKAAMQVREGMLRVQTEALELAKKSRGAKMDSEIDILDKKYKISGPAEDLAELGGESAKYSKETFNPNFKSYVLQKWGGRVGIEEVIDKDKLPTARIQEYQLAVSQGEKRSFTEWDMATKGSGTTVNINNPGMPPAIDKAASESYGKGIGDRASKIMAGGTEAINQNFQLNLVSDALDKGAKTGYGEELLLDIKSAGQTLGMDVGDLSGQELIRKISNEMALRLRNPESGLGLTGNTSNKDLDFLKASVVGLQRTEQGNRKIIDSMKKYNNLRIDLAKEQQRLIKENKGMVPSELDSKLLEFSNNYKFFSEGEKNQIQKLSQKVIKTATQKSTGRKVLIFEDGSQEYAN